MKLRRNKALEGRKIYVNQWGVGTVHRAIESTNFIAYSVKIGGRLILTTEFRAFLLS